MANYANLISAIQNVVKTNGNNEITGALLQQSLLAMINSLGGYYQFAGIATPSTNPGTPDQNVFYLASTAGTYSNFGSIVIAENEAAILKYNGTWSKDSSGFATSEKVSQLEAEVDGYVSETKTVKNVSSITNVGRYISNANQWAAGSSAQGKFIPVTPGKKYGVKFISTYNGEGSNVTMVTNNDATTGNSVSYATGFTRKYCAEGTEYSFVAPLDAAYFWVLVRKGSSTYFTYEVYEYSSEHIKGLVEKVSDLQNDVSELDSSVSQLQQDVSIKMDKVIEEDITDTADNISDKYIQYSSGRVANPSSDALYKMFYFKVNDAYSVRCYLGLDGTTPAAIAFYSSLGFDPTNQFPSGTGESDGQGGYRDAYYMQSDSIAGENKTGWFEAIVPPGAIWCAVSNRGSIFGNPIIKKYRNLDIASFEDETDKKFDSIGWASLRNYIELGSITIGTNSWTYGNSTSRARIRNGITIPLKKGDILRCTDNGLVYYLGWRSGGVYYRKGWISGDFIATIDAEFVFVTRYSTEATITDLDRFLDAFFIHSLTFFNNKTNGLIVKLKHLNPFKRKKNYGHLFIDQITKEIAYAIPCQSILDVEITARLGFDIMEGNVHATATPGKYIVLHGIQGKLSKDIVDLNGDTADNVTISSTSFNDLMNNYRYRSKYAKNQIHISSLEDFLYACVHNNITPIVTYVDTTEVGIIKNICGDNFILYDSKGQSRWFYDGLIFSWNTDETVDAIINSAKSIGAPLMIGLNASLTDSEYRQIIDAVHEIGGLVGIAGCYLTGGETARRMRLGFDFNGSNRECNDVCGNIISLDNRVGTDWLNLNSASVDSENTITINAGSNISVKASELNAAPIMKGKLKIRYSGKLSIYMMGGGSLTDEPVSSDGGQFVEWSAYYVQGNKNNNFNYMPEVYICAVDNTTMIYEIEYKVDSV